jgi:hypothetical protein
MNRKIAISSVSILASLALLGVGVYAADLTDATSTANVATAANPHLQIAPDAGGGNPGTFSNSIAGGLTTSHIAPEHDQTIIFFLKNTGDQSLALNALFSNVGGTGLGTTTGTLEHDLQIAISCVDNTTSAAIGSITSQSFSNYEGGTPPPTPLLFTGSGNIAPNQVAKCTVTSHLGTGNNDAGQSLTYSAAFGGN